jgi:hypothetical protein
LYGHGYKPKRKLRSIKETAVPDDATAVAQILSRMEENLRDAIYWREKYEALSAKGKEAYREMVLLMDEEHGAAAGRLALEIYKRHGLIAQVTYGEADECQTPASR